MDAIIDAPRAELTLRIERRFAAPRALVFRAWTEPLHLRRWSAPHGYVIPEAEGELRPGGAWRTTMRAPDGTEHRLIGTYREIVPPRRLVFTHAWLDDAGRPGPETLVTVELEEIPEGTLLRLTQTGFTTEAARDGHGGGWGEALDRLTAHLATAPG
jgi:uncharacterized protein YndB with AHSA1/START domain